MKKLSKPAFLKTSISLIILMFLQVATFAANPQVYNSQSNLSNLSVKEMIEQTWVWILVGCIVVVAVSAFFATKETEKKSQATH